MTSRRERQLIALNTLMVNLQRLYVFDAATAKLTGIGHDEVRRARLQELMDAAGSAFGGMLQGGELSPDVRDEMLRLRAWLKVEVDRLYVRHDPSAPLREQAAFGSAHVYASDDQVKGETAIAEALGDSERADWLRQQQVYTMNELVGQANTALDSSSRGEANDDAAQFIVCHVLAALEAESSIASELDGVASMLEGRDPH